MEVGQAVTAPSMGNIPGHIVATLTADGAKGLVGQWHSGNVRKDWGKGSVYLVQFEAAPYDQVDAGQERDSNRVLLPESALVTVTY